jgi:WhiB family transcriptional regulator, redox-sensing transcriptional regulator
MIPVYVRPDWHADANCRGLDPELFFPERGEISSAAKDVCHRCDVQVECLTFALNSGEHFGIWGGMSERQRRRIRSTKPAPGRKLTDIEHNTNAGYYAHRRRGEDACDDCKRAHARTIADQKSGAA